MHNLSQPFANLALSKLIVSWFIVGFVAVFFLTPSFAQAPANPSGLQLPRFASTHSKPINVRVGPGTKYEIAWIYVKSKIPVEIIKEFDTWRKIRDFSGQEGWVHQSLLSGKRIGRINIAADEQIALYAKPSNQSDIRAQIGALYPVDLVQCNGKWCKVEVSFKNKKDKLASLSGYIEQIKIWGVYKNEKFD